MKVAKVAIDAETDYDVLRHKSSKVFSATGDWLTSFDL
jgi:hypothetical protein